MGVEHASYRMSTPTTPLRLSVVFAARRSLSSIRSALECLLSQTAAPRIELILSADSPELLREAEDFLAPRSRFAQSRFLLHHTLNLARARALSVAETTGDVVAFSEDHCFPEPNWAEELLAAFESSANIQAAAPVMLNPNPETAMSRVQFVFFFGHHRKHPSSRPRFANTPSLPAHNTAYRRDVLTEVLGDNSLLAEVFLLDKICTSRPQAQLMLCTRTSLEHVNMSRLYPAMRHAFLGGRIFGSQRASLMGWRPATKMLRFVLFPLVPLIVIRRSAPLLRDETSLARIFSNFSTAWLLKTIHAFGESIGTCFGLGRAADAYADLECDRGHFVRPAERHLLSRRAVPR